MVILKSMPWFGTMPCLIRDMVMGKKAYLFCRDLDACKRAAMMYSLFGACKVLDKNPERWLCNVLKNTKTMSDDKHYYSSSKVLGR